MVDLLAFGPAIGLALLAILLAGSSLPPAAALGIAAVAAAFAGTFIRKLFQAQRLVTGTQHAQIELMTRQLQQQRQAVDILAEGLEIAIFLCDSRAAIVYANRTAMEMFRFPDPVGRTVLAVTLSYDLVGLVQECFRTGVKQHAELTFTYPGDRVGLVEVWPEPGGERVFLSVYEITDLRRLERVRSDFVANVSHELRTPLSTIRAMAETLIDDKAEDREMLDRYLQKIVAEVDRLSLIANDLLILSASESNPARKQACDIAEIYRSVTQQLQLKAKEKALKLSFVGPDHLLIEANGAQMSQVALNLVDNAINYTPTGSVEVYVSREGDSVEARVTDTGIGIASEHLPRVFERFYRVDKGRSRATGGTGLGLSIVRHIVEAHGGTVTVNSALNEGSSFRVRLPIGDVTAEAVSEA